jgi:nicotinic acid mononucleotide adenylyltransferase
MDGELADIKTDIETLKLRVGDLEKKFEQAELERSTMNATLNRVEEQNARILAFIAGTDKIFGFTRKHWRTILKFGAGFVTAYGISNPIVQRELNFILAFFGI